MQADREGVAELITWDSVVPHPFLQVVTDLRRGGVAYWCVGVESSGVSLAHSTSSGSVAQEDGLAAGSSKSIIIRKHIMGSMMEVYDFVAKAVCHLPGFVAKPGLPRIYDVSMLHPWQPTGCL